MGRPALALAFLSCGLTPFIQYLYCAGLLDSIPYLDRACCIPALLLGINSWCRQRSFAHAWPLMCCLAVLFTGIFIADESEQGRGLLVFAAIATAIPIGALIVDLKATKWCAYLFMASVLLNVLFIVFLIGGIGGETNRLGYLVWNDVRISDPNDLATQLGIAAILSISLLQHRERKTQSLVRHSSSKSTPDGSAWLMFLLAFFSTGILLTASRSGILSLAVVMILFACSKRTKASHRLAFCLALLAVSVVAFSTDNTISRRFNETENTLAFGDRLPIWQAALSILEADSSYLKLGVGTGGVEKALADSGTFDDLRSYEDGIYRKYSHNTYVEWLLSSGLAGLPVILWIAYVACLKAWRLDRYDGSNDRRLLLAYGAIISMTTVLYRLPFATPLCALVIAMLSGPFLAPWQNQHVRVSRRRQLPLGTRRMIHCDRLPITQSSQKV